MNHPLARTTSTSSLRRKRSKGTLATSSVTPSDQISRSDKTASYQRPSYRAVLESKSSYLHDYVRSGEKGIIEDSRRICQTLLEAAQEVPKDSLFDDDIFSHTCDIIDGRNGAKVAQDISRLLVPSAQALAGRSTELECLVESVYEGWSNSIPLSGTRPQPDYSVGFKREAFSAEQLEKLAPLIGDCAAGDQSYFMATSYMYFPLLTCEVKGSCSSLEIANH